MDRISRRDLLKGAASASFALAGLPALSDSGAEEVSSATRSSALPDFPAATAILP
jgi:TAT (twin-arginine translocation) pathway signal sequence